MGLIRLGLFRVKDLDCTDYIYICMCIHLLHNYVPPCRESKFNDPFFLGPDTAYNKKC